MLERLFLRRQGQQDLLTMVLARQMAMASHTIGRQVGVLIDRQGRVTHVFVGDAHRIYLPDVGRARAGWMHRRGLRHVHTILDHQGLHRDDLADLRKLRLDAVVGLRVGTQGEALDLEYAYVLPATTEAGEDLKIEKSRSVDAVSMDFAALIAGLEAEHSRQPGRKHVPDKVQGQTRALLVGVYPDKKMAQWRLAELQELAKTAGVAVADTMVQIRRMVDHRYVLGRGKLEEAVLLCLDQDVELLIVDHDLTPAQARAIAAMSALKVLDRTQLILDIFAQHAQSRDGKLQVELAQLKYTLPRLTDLDAGLSRLTGGIGGRGPGETKLEINRRRARDRITRLEREIDALSKQRQLRRQRRQAGHIPIVSVVGYTNAGKSTLLNRLTQSQVGVADKLFATLDPSTRRLRFPKEREAIITDTVGFIRELPPALMQAFRATLEELEGADLLLHVVDAADDEREEKMHAVEQILDTLQLGTIPRLVVMNKSDCLEPFGARALALRVQGCAISARTGAGLDVLVQTIGKRLWQHAAIPQEPAWIAEVAQEHSGSDKG